MEIVGRTIGRYQVQEHIGEGGMAHVYKAFDPSINRTVALKILKAEHCADEEHNNRFLREGKAAGALTHPNIVTIYDVGSLEGAPYIMMELLEGESLGDILQQGRRLPITTIIRIAIQLAKAMDYAHTRGVVHRDMKPDNIILGADGESVKITDFGIARMDSSPGNETTQVGMMLGTPRYMSPEQASGTIVDGRADLFAVGVIMYEMITGQKAFDAESLPTLIMQIVKKNPVPIRQLTTDAPAGLQKIVNKLLQKNPQRRFQSGKELQEALLRELSSVQSHEEEQRGYLPLQVKWTAIMGAVVAVAMTVASTLVFRAQSDALTRQAVDSGLSLAKFIAVQAAIPVLGEDWVTLESLVEDAAARQTFRYLVVADHRGIVRGASDSSLVGERWEPSNIEQTLLDGDTIQVQELEQPVFNFSLPVLFDQTVVGHLDLGVDTTELDAAMTTTGRMMAMLALAIVLAVSLLIYAFNKLIAKNLLLATSALQLLGRGQLETRISRKRDDEFGDLFNAVNHLADGIEKQLEGSGVTDGPLLDTVVVPEGKLEISGIVQGNPNDQTIVRSSDVNRDDESA
ncbi:serine/threonine-protein kinase [Kineobactrum salinum]|uniref:non-specific serine/threonine protein kinase n=1 Tax=Kineobactrum salinum TaxID=2708301 RepID=A0A6C0U4Z9_9GAMM|nr:serine/threonine-protein kinase [Kineobactrum salinum]QIB66057.1 protein kinase [Kineobactrum salinum]